MKYQVGDMLKYDSKYDTHNKGIAIVIRTYQQVPKETGGSAITTSYDLLWLSKTWDVDIPDLISGYRQWQIEDNGWSKLS